MIYVGLSHAMSSIQITRYSIVFPCMKPYKRTIHALWNYAQFHVLDVGCITTKYIRCHEGCKKVCNACYVDKHCGNHHVGCCRIFILQELHIGCFMSLFKELLDMCPQVTK
jgi:hypothetical protein